jgi:voltage-dependent potassium channel beta subunit
MQYRNLGNSGLFISALSYGSWVTFKTQITPPTTTDLMARAYEKGVNFFDNAETYANGESEVIMGQALKALAWERSSYIVSSKVFWGGKHPTQMGLSRKHVIEACHQSLKRLNLDYIDLYYCHRPDRDTPVLETVRAMDTLIRQGKILYWGTSEWEAPLIAQANEVALRFGLTPPSVEQPQYNLFERQKVESDYAELYSKYTLGLTTWSPLSSGILSGKYDKGIPADSRLNLSELSWLKEYYQTQEGLGRIDKARALSLLAREVGATPSQLAIAWCLANPHVSSVILGARTIAQLDENLATMDHLKALHSPEVLSRVEAIVQSTPAKPANFKGH